VRNWAEQAQTVTDATQPAGRSAATAAEIRLREALHKCSLAAGEYSEHTNRPYRLRTAVCCKLLEEFATLAGPFSGILHTLSEELVCCAICSTLSQHTWPAWYAEKTLEISCRVFIVSLAWPCCRSVQYTATLSPIKAAAHAWTNSHTMWWFRNWKHRILHWCQNNAN
jgi:hypothetical protein